MKKRQVQILEAPQTLCICHACYECHKKASALNPKVSMYTRNVPQFLLCPRVQLGQATPKRPYETPTCLSLSYWAPKCPFTLIIKLYFLLADICEEDVRPVLLYRVICYIYVYHIEALLYCNLSS